MAEGPPRSPLYAHSAKKNVNLGCFAAVYKVSLNPGYFEAVFKVSLNPDYFEVGCYFRLEVGGYLNALQS
jgi:hypothetical protein